MTLDSRCGTRVLLRAGETALEGGELWAQKIQWAVKGCQAGRCKLPLKVGVESAPSQVQRLKPIW